MPAKLFLQWDEFCNNIHTSLASLRETNDFADVTLVCEDGQQVEAHKVVLAASSPVFQNLLKKNKHPHPLIYMRGVQSLDLVAIIDFLYFGEANVLQENLDSFLALAEELRLKGLTGSGNSGEAKEPTKDFKENFENNPIKRKTAKQSSAPSRPQYKTPPSTSTVIATENSSTDANNQDLDDQINSVITKNGSKGPNGRELFSCNICGKQGKPSHLRDHIEANHITGLSHACNICGKASRSRSALRMHKNDYHKNMLRE